MRNLVFVLGAAGLFGAPALAADCPAFYRFVDFGQDTSAGPIRGGPTYRAEGFDGQALLRQDQTQCRDALHQGVDGRGNPIPIVSRIGYDPHKAGLPLLSLQLDALAGIAAAAERSAADHRARLDRQGVRIHRGTDHLCASFDADTGAKAATRSTESDIATGAFGADAISCQLVSPLENALPLVVYCDAAVCTMPMLALNEHVVASARWTQSPATVGAPQLAGPEIAQIIAQIYDFVSPLSSWAANFGQLDR